MKKTLTDQELAARLKKAGLKMQLSDDSRQVLKFKLMDVINSGETRITKRYWLMSKRSVMLIPMFVMALVVAGSGTIAVANSAKSGDVLHSVDLWAESVQEKLVVNEEAKARLQAAFNSERLAELEAIEDIKLEELNETAKARWEARHAKAIALLSASIEKLGEVKALFEAKLEATPDEDEKKIEVLERIIGHIGEMEDRREQRLEKIEEREYPGIGKLQVRNELKTWIDERPEIRTKLHEEVRLKFGDMKLDLGSRLDGRINRDDDDETEAEAESDTKVEINL